MSTPPNNSEQRLFLGILLRCCNVYARLYLNANKTAYAGHCPRCAKPVRVEVVEQGGQTNRFFGTT